MKNIRDQVLANIEQAWELIFKYYIRIFIGQAPLQKHLLSDPTNPHSRAILQLYSMETWLHQSINKATRYKDKGKIKNLAPFAAMLFNVLGSPQFSIVEPESP